MIFYVDYFDYWLGGIGHRMQMKNRNERLKYDLLCINPETDKMIFTLTETLLEDSNRILVQYKDFWEKGIFKIALDKKYRNANTYIEDRLKILNNSPAMKDNFELEIYQSDTVDYFINRYLVHELNLRGKRSFILHRTTNADFNNRVLLKEKINQSDFVYTDLEKALNKKEMSEIINYFNDRADDKKMIFQREYILNEMFQKYPQLNKNRAFLYGLFDQNYNDAMALSVDAVRLSTLKHTLNAVSLSNFIYNFDYSLYRKIASFSPHQIYVLAMNPSWKRFVNEIRELYEHLFFLKKVNQNYNIYKYYQKRVAVEMYLSKFVLDIMDYVVKLVDIPQAYWYFYYMDFRRNAEKFMDKILKNNDYMIYVASDVFERKKLIRMLVDDIGEGC